MTRRDRRIYKKKTRRIGVVLASLTLAVGTAGLGGIAFAGGGGVGGGGYGFTSHNNYPDPHCFYTNGAGGRVDSTCG